MSANAPNLYAIDCDAGAGEIIVQRIVAAGSARPIAKRAPNSAFDVAALLDFQMPCWRDGDDSMTVVA
jgi:hypothetical protein